MPNWFAEPLVALFAMLRRGAAAQVTDAVHVVTGSPPRTIEDFLRDHAALFVPTDMAATRPV